MVLSRGKIAFRVNRETSEKGRSEPGLCGGHLKYVVGLSGIRQNGLVGLPVPEHSEDHSGHLPADMANHIHVVQPFGHLLFVVGSEHRITLHRDCGRQPDGAA